MSAPHMYVTVLKALELNAGKSFLNVGSGSGYLSCLAASLLGEEGVSHGVEISEGACQFSRDKAKEWHSKLSEARQAAGDESSVISLDGISFVNANCFDIDVLNTVNTMKYDRIYVGAGCPEFRKEFFLSMLADNGIMVVPINEKNQMLSIRKFYGRVYSLKPISNVNFAPLLDTAVRPDEEALLCELAALEGGVCLGGEIQQSILKVKAAPSSASFIIHPAPPHASPFAAPGTGGGGGWQSGGSSPSSSVSSPATTTAAVGVAGSGPGPTSPLFHAGARSLNADTVVRVRLPALGTWHPLSCLRRFVLIQLFFSFLQCGPPCTSGTSSSLPSSAAPCSPSCWLTTASRPSPFTGLHSPTSRTSEEPAWWAITSRAAAAARATELAAGSVLAAALWAVCRTRSGCSSSPTPTGTTPHVPSYTLPILAA